MKISEEPWCGVADLATRRESIHGGSPSPSMAQDGRPGREPTPRFSGLVHAAGTTLLPAILNFELHTDIESRIAVAGAVTVLSHGWRRRAPMDGFTACHSPCHGNPAQPLPEIETQKEITIGYTYCIEGRHWWPCRLGQNSAGQQALSGHAR